MKVSACLITLDAARTLDGCLESLDFVDEIVVLDHGSTDGTRDICARRGARVLTGEFKGFGAAKSSVTAAARNRWVLSIDADEEVTPDLRAAIMALPDAPPAAAFAINRLPRFLGRWIRHSGWHPDWVTRLFDRELAGFNELRVHESVVTDGPVARLDGMLLHYAYEDLHQWVEKQNRYGTLAAEEAAAEGRSGSVVRAIARGNLAFLRNYVLKQGWRDGVHGFVLCLLISGATFIKHLKIWLATRSPEDRQP